MMKQKSAQRLQGIYHHDLDRIIGIHSATFVRGIKFSLKWAFSMHPVAPINMKMTFIDFKITYEPLHQSKKIQ